MPQLKMLFNAAKNPLPALEIAGDFYLDTIKDSDLDKYNELRKSVNFPEWTAEYLQTFRSKVLDDAMFVIKEKSTDRFCAAATAEKTDMPDYPQIGVLGWVMTHPDFRGHHLGKSVSVAAMHKLYRQNYRTFSLLTDDFRLAAVKTYLKLSWQPWLYLEDMPSRWQTLAEKLQLDFDSLNCIPEKINFPL